MKRGLFWRSHCPHSSVVGIYGDSINLLGTRLLCMRCYRKIDGPVIIATIRERERAEIAQERGNSD